MDIIKPNSKQESIASLLALTQKLEEKEVMRVTDITRGMVLAKLAKQSDNKEKEVKNLKGNTYSLLKRGFSMKEIILNENVTVYRPEVADKQALKNVYDILNKINQRVHKDEYFYTPEQVEELKKDPRNVWL